ncbi:MAG: type II transport protein [Candidatus Buchananbacteria bacterium]|nr:type II transport protein [Candidatus Buchananbacteria bacterium]
MKKGFTLIEFSITIVVVSLITLVTIPVFINYQKNTKLRSEARVLATNLRLTQQLAITEQVLYDLTLYPTSNEYKIINSETNEVIKTVDIAAEVTINQINNLTANTVTFNPTGGAAQTGNIVLINTKNETSTVEIKPSGYVEIIEQ